MQSVHSTVRDFAVDDWNRLAGDNPFGSHGWLLTVESCSRAATEPLYFALRGGGDLQAAAVCYASKANPGVETLDDLLLGRLRTAANRIGFSFLPALICGPAQGYGWHIGIDPRIEETEHRAIREALLNAIEGEADRRQLPLSFVQVLSDETGLESLLKDRGYVSSENVPIARMDVHWRSIQEYFEHLPSRRRREYQRERRRNIEDGTSIEIIRSCEGIEDRLFDLLEGNAHRHGTLGFPFERRAISEMIANMGSDAVVFVARKDDTVSGVYLVLRNGRTAVAYAVGIDWESSGDDFTYFRLVYYELIEYAIGEGIERIFFGRGVYQAKIRRGCRLAGSRIYTRSQGTGGFKTAAWYPIASWWNRRKQAVQ